MVKKVNALYSRFSLNQACATPPHLLDNLHFDHFVKINLKPRLMILTKWSKWRLSSKWGGVAHACSKWYFTQCTFTHLHGNSVPVCHCWKIPCKKSLLYTMTIARPNDDVRRLNDWGTSFRLTVGSLSRWYFPAMTHGH